MILLKCSLFCRLTAGPGRKSRPSFFVRDGNAIAKPRFPPAVARGAARKRRAGAHRCRIESPTPPSYPSPQPRLHEIGRAHAHHDPRTLGIAAALSRPSHRTGVPHTIHDFPFHTPRI